MDLAVFFSMLIDDPGAWNIAVLMLASLVAAFFICLWLFRVTRRVIRKRITCPEKESSATVDFLARVGEQGFYREVLNCSLIGGAKEISCRKGCLSSPAVLGAPLVSIRRA